MNLGLLSSGGPLGWLTAATAALLAGPLVARWTRRRARVRAGLDGYVGGVLSALVLLHVLPECAEQLGGGALLVAAAGLLGPALLRAQLGRDTALSLAGLGLGLHAAMDGAALLTPSLGPDPDRAALALAVVVHRFPMGLLVVGLAGGGRRGAALAVGGLTVATLIGMAVAPTLGVAAESPGLAVFQALVGGSLLHVLLDRSPLSALDGPPTPRVAQLAAEAVGFALGVASSFVLPAHDHALGHSPGESAALGVALLLAFGLRKTPRGWVLSRLARP